MFVGTWSLKNFLAGWRAAPRRSCWWGTLRALGDSLITSLFKWYVFSPRASSQTVGFFMLCSPGPSLLGGRPRWTKAQIEGNRGSALDSGSGRHPGGSKEQVAQTDGKD